MTLSPLNVDLTDGALELVGRLTQASNATFLAELAPESANGGEVAIRCVYKPMSGERPLWDFPDQTLALREVAAYELSAAAGFDVVPPTVLFDGPLGTGSLQAWIGDLEQGPDFELVDIVPSNEVPEHGWFEVLEGIGANHELVTVIHADDARLRSMALFDAIINNADRKGGHIIGAGEKVFGVDHGVSFHHEPKLRTLLWGWQGDRLTPVETELTQRCSDVAKDVLGELLSRREIQAVRRRCRDLVDSAVMPSAPGDWPAVPWPPF